MVIRKYKPLENLQGEGEVFEEDRKLAKVRYDLSIEEEILITEDSEETKGGQSRTGSIDVLEGEIGLLDTGKMLILHMADGNKVEFSITNGDVNAGRFSIELSGKFF